MSKQELEERQDRKVHGRFRGMRRLASMLDPWLPFKPALSLKSVAVRGKRKQRSELSIEAIRLAN